MKHNLLLFAFLFTISTLFAQYSSHPDNTEKIQIDSIVVTRLNGETEYTQGVYRYDFDFLGRSLQHNRFYRPAFDMPFFEEENYQYLDDGHQIIATSKRREQNKDDFINHEKTVSLIDDNGYLLEDHFYEWDIANDAWTETMGSENTYNEKRQRIKTLIFKLLHKEDGIELYSKDTLVYNDAGLVESILTQRPLDGQLANTKKTENSYQNDTLLSTQFKYEWDSLENSWNALTRTDYLYSNLNRTEIMNVWNRALSDFIKSNKQEFYFTVEGDVREQILYNWSNDEGWKPHSKYDYQLDYSYLPEDVIIPQIFKGFDTHRLPVGRLMASSISSFGIDEWYWYRKDIFYYSSFQPLSLAEISAQNLKIFPNPASHFITIERELGYVSFAIYSIDGRKIVESHLSGNRIIVSFLQRGTYILKLFGDGKVSGTAVFIKE